MRSFMGAVPWFAPGMLLWTAMAILASPLVARRLRTSRGHAAFLLMALGLTLMATLTPTADGLTGVAQSLGRCNLSRWWLAPLTTLVAVNDASLNVALFVPLGIALGALPSSRTSLVLVACAFLLPLAIETGQLVLPSLGRSCQSADVLDNTLGLALGLGIGLAGSWLLARARTT